MNNIKKKYDIELCKERIREMQRARGYTNKDMAEITGLKQNVYNNIIREKGGNKYIKSEHLILIAKALLCSPEYLTGDSDDEKYYGYEEPDLRDGKHVFGDRELIYLHHRLLDKVGNFFLHNLDILKIIYLVTLNLFQSLARYQIPKQVRNDSINKIR